MAHEPWSVVQWLHVLRVARHMVCSFMASGLPGACCTALPVTAVKTKQRQKRARRAKEHFCQSDTTAHAITKLKTEEVEQFKETLHHRDKFKMWVWMLNDKVEDKDNRAHPRHKVMDSWSRPRAPEPIHRPGKVHAQQFQEAKMHLKTNFWI